MRNWLLMLLSVFAVGIHAGGVDEAVRGFGEAFSQVLSVEEYEKIMFGPEIDKINHEIKALAGKSGNTNQKKIDKLNKKLEEFSARAERDLNRRLDLVGSASKSVTPGMKNTYAPLRSAVREVLDFAFNCQNKMIRQLERKEKDLTGKLNREKSKSPDKEQTGLREELKECQAEIEKKNELCRKIRETQRKIADDNILDVLKTLSFAAAPPQGQAETD